MPLPVLDYAKPADRRALDRLIGRLRAQAAGSGDVAASVARIVDDVAERGDAAVVDAMRKWTDPAFDAARIRVLPEELADAHNALAPELCDALTAAIDNVRAYQGHILPQAPPRITQHGAELGLRFTPMQRVGLAVPGGKAAYPSSVIMNAVPAQVAGVDELAIVCPPPTGVHGGDVNPLVLAVCHMLGISEVYRIGGAQAIAALAFGADSVQPVDFIAGPGNAFVQQAKRQVFGLVGIDGFYGPSEVVVLADGTAEPDHVAADLLAQAEHDPGCCFLISMDRATLDNINAAVDEQLPDRARRQVIEPALAEWSAAVLVEDEETALALVDRLAAEHVTLAVADPQAALTRLHHGGAFFLGCETPVASGDYYAGPSHCLPTGTTARFTSGISVYTFLKRSSIERYPAGLPDAAIDHIAALADAEGLEAHAHSVTLRRTR